jgi:hypothetical protein
VLDHVCPVSSENYVHTTSVAIQAWPTSLSLLSMRNPKRILKNGKRTTTHDPVWLKQWRTSAKRLHTMSLNRVLFAVRKSEYVDQIKIFQAILVRDFDILAQIHHRYMEICKFNPEESYRETRWAINISSKQFKPLTDIPYHLEIH